MPKESIKINNPNEETPLRDIPEDKWKNLSKRLEEAGSFLEKYISWEYLKERYLKKCAVVILDEEGDIVGYGMLREASAEWDEMGTIYSGREGLGEQIVKKLRALADKRHKRVYAITKSSNQRMIHRFTGAGFELVGGNKAEIIEWLDTNAIPYNLQRDFGNGRVLYASKYDKS